MIQSTIKSLHDSLKRQIRQQIGNISPQLADDIDALAESALQQKQLNNQLHKKFQEASIQMTQQFERERTTQKQRFERAFLRERTTQKQRFERAFLHERTQKQRFERAFLHERTQKQRFERAFQHERTQRLRFERAFLHERTQRLRFETEINMLAVRCQQLTLQLRQSEERFEEFERQKNAELDYFESRQKGLLGQLRKLNENLQIQRQINQRQTNGYRKLAQYIPEYL